MYHMTVILIGGLPVVQVLAKVQYVNRYHFAPAVYPSSISEVVRSESVFKDLLLI